MEISPLLLIITIVHILNSITDNIVLRDEHSEQLLPFPGPTAPRCLSRIQLSSDLKGSSGTQVSPTEWLQNLAGP